MSGETRKTEFDSAGGDKLAAALELPSGQPVAYALFAHCFSCSKDIKAAREFARSLRAQGFAVLRFDFTGLGASEGDFANTNFSSNVEDLVSAADFLRREFEAPSIIIGHSLGGAAAIVAATRIPEVKGVATIGAPSSSSHVAKQLGNARSEIERTGVGTVSLAGRPFTIKKQFLDDLDHDKVTDAAAELHIPLLVMHSPIDETVGIKNATEIFIAAKHPKSFVSLDDADHLLSRKGDAIYAATVLSAWATRFIDEPSAAHSSPPVESSPSTEEFKGGARATGVPGKKFAVALNADGHELVLDAGSSEGGDDLGPNPSRTVEAALAACALMTMKMYADRKKWTIDGSVVEVKRAPGVDAHVSTILEKSISFPANLDQAQKARLLEIADKCPVHRMLSKGVEIRPSNG